MDQPPYCLRTPPYTAISYHDRILGDHTDNNGNSLCFASNFSKKHITMRLCNGDHQMFRNSFCASSWYLKIITPSPRTHFLFLTTFETQFDVNWIKNRICHFKNTHAAPNRYQGCCLPWNKLQLILHQITLVGCLHCFQPTKKTFSNRLNHGLSQSPSKNIMCNSTTQEQHYVIHIATTKIPSIVKDKRKDK